VAALLGGIEPLEVRNQLLQLALTKRRHIELLEVAAGIL
jgi:hypothetical protein